MDWKDYDGLGYLTDTTLEDVAEKTLDAFVESQAAADVPVILLECDALDAPQGGELLYFFELANAICAVASGVDPLAALSNLALPEHSRGSYLGNWNKVFCFFMILRSAALVFSPDT